MELNKIKNIIIHIGYPKTGTTWFKKYFYPIVTNATTLYIDDFEYNTSKDNSYFKILTQLDTTKENLIIVSHKFTGLENFKWDNGIYREFFIKNLKKLFPNASIVVFLRNQIDFIASAYSSYLSHGGTYTFKHLFKTGQLNDGKMFSFEYLNYINLINLYKRYFDNNNVHIFLYEDFQENGFSFIKKFSNELNLEVNPEKINFNKYNEKFRKHLISFIRFTNKFNKKGVKPKKVILNLPFIFSWINKRSLLKINKNKIWGNTLTNEEILGIDLINYLKSYYKDYNKQLITELGLTNIQKYNYPL